MMYKGKLTSWRDDKGFGFIKTDELPKDVFIHISSLKSMPRKPKVGDIIHFEVEQQDDGKNRAINCKIEGLQAIKQDEGRKRRSKPAQKASKRNESQSSMIMKLWPVVLLVVVLVSVDKLAERNDELDQTAPTTSGSSSGKRISSQGGSALSAQADQYKCDGRQYCNQMT